MEFSHSLPLGMTIEQSVIPSPNRDLNQAELLLIPSDGLFWPDTYLWNFR